MKLGLSALMAGVLISGACSQPAEVSVTCPAILIFGLNVSVVDSVTGAGTGSGATVIARDGAYTDSTTRAANGSDVATFGLAAGRAGTYAVTIRKTGYTSWLRSGIQVAKAVCGVTPVAVTARLQPGP
jgi:hypothetical protein